jgi:hypothetical protein
VPVELDSIVRRRCSFLSQLAELAARSRHHDGGDDGTRTHDPLLAKQVL